VFLNGVSVASENRSQLTIFREGRGLLLMARTLSREVVAV